MNISRTLCLMPKRSYICYPATRKYLAFHKDKLEEEYTHTLDYLYNPNKEIYKRDPINLKFHREKLEEEYTHTLDYLYNPNKEILIKQFNYSSPYPDESKLPEVVNYIGSDDDLVVFKGIPKKSEKDKFLLIS